MIRHSSSASQEKKDKIVSNQHKSESRARIFNYKSENNMQEYADLFMCEAARLKYSYNFEWMGRPIIQYPQDIIAIQEVIWNVKPDLIIETGIAHGGSLILSSSILALIEYEEALNSGTMLDPKNPHRMVLGIDIDIRSHNKTAINAHPMRSRINMIEGSSIAQDVVSQVHQYTLGKRNIMVILDSNHTHDHVLEELKIYAPMVSIGSYCIVMDTIIENLPDELSSDRPWGKGNNPKTAVEEYLKLNNEFSHDFEIMDKLLITASYGGYIKRVI